MLPTDIDPTVILDRVTRCIASGDITSKPCRKLLKSVQGLTKLKDACLKKKNKKTVVCRIVNQIPGLPNLPGGRSPTSRTSPGCPAVSATSSASAGPASARPSGPRPHPRPAHRLFDPALVQLLVPGMVTR